MIDHTPVCIGQKRATGSRWKVQVSRFVRKGLKQLIQWYDILVCMYYTPPIIVCGNGSEFCIFGQNKWHLYVTLLDKKRTSSVVTQQQKIVTLASKCLTLLLEEIRRKFQLTEERSVVIQRPFEEDWLDVDDSEELPDDGRLQFIEVPSGLFYSMYLCTNICLKA